MQDGLCDEIGMAAAIQDCQAQAGLYRLLGRCLEEEPDQALLELLRGPLAAPLRDNGVSFSKAFYRTPLAELQATLAEEFTALFVAPGGVLPYRSVFETGRTFQEPCDQALAAYREAGFGFQRRYSGEFADQIGVMLGFVACLYDAEAEVLAADDTEQAAGWRERRQRFVLDQLGPWAAGWCRRARTAALHEYYAQLLALTERVLWADISVLADRKRLRELAGLNQRAPVKLDYNADFRKASGL